MGITFSNEYLRFDANGEVLEQGEIDKEDYYVAARRFAGPENLGGSAFNHLATTSADVNAVNNALNAGSDPSNLVTGPAVLFQESPTTAGMIIIEKEISDHVAKLQSLQEQQKPWWKFW